MKFSWKYITGMLAQALKQGMTPRKLALTCALGVVIGIFPIFGTTTLLCLGASILFRLNVPVMQLVNYLVAPLQLILILPFIKMGSYGFGLNPFPYTTDQLVSMFKTDFWLLMKEAGFAVMMGVGVWAIVSIPLFFIVFYFALWCFTRWRKPFPREL